MLNRLRRMRPLYPVLYKMFGQTDYFSIRIGSLIALPRRSCSRWACIRRTRRWSRDIQSDAGRIFLASWLLLVAGFYLAVLEKTKFALTTCLGVTLIFMACSPNFSWTATSVYSPAGRSWI